MSEFKDTTGRTWQVEIDSAAIERVRDFAGIDLSRATAGTLVALSADVRKFLEILYAVLAPQIEASGIEPADVAESIWGDSLYQAVDGLNEQINKRLPRGQRGNHKKIKRVRQ